MDKSVPSPAMFKGFDPYKLSSVHVSSKKIGAGSYATVLEAEYLGLKCAAKRIHMLLLKCDNATYPICRFQKECHLLSQIRHPNIVQFLGVHFEEDNKPPILIMEFLPTNLTFCIEKYGILPNDVSYSVLHDIILGLYYLHSQTPCIIHRDLSSNNVLLNSYMKAKISDLGVARIINISPEQVYRMTETPGTPTYMPPEVMIANPVYGSSVDIFSYGIIAIHVFSGKWPEPHLECVCMKDGEMIAFTEAERRENFLKLMGENHPLMELVLRCIHNDPKCRCDAKEITKVTEKMVSQFPASFSNQFEMHQYIKREEEQTGLSEEKESKRVEEKLHVIDSLQQKLQSKHNDMEAKKTANRVQTSELITKLEESKKENDALNLRNCSLERAMRHHKETIDNAVLMLNDAHWYEAGLGEIKEQVEHKP